MEWIKTTDKLPELNKEVLAVTRDPFGKACDYYVAFLFKSGIDGRLMWADGRDFECELDEVVAWLPFEPYTE